MTPKLVLRKEQNNRKYMKVQDNDQSVITVVSNKPISSISFFISLMLIAVDVQLIF